MEDSSSMKHSDINRKPMSFSMMRKKIESQEYPSWKLFVQDFQWICHDAMDYHQKDSVFWKAAKSMLDQGTAYLEKITEKAKGILDFLIKTNKRNETQGLEASDNRNTSMDNAVGMEMEQSKLKKDVEIPCSGLWTKNSTKLHIRKDVKQVECDATFLAFSDKGPFGHPFPNLCTTSEGTIPELEKNLLCTNTGLDNLTLSGPCKEVDDTLVDITESECIGDDLRFYSHEQGTESSSSFGGTDDDSETCGSVELESDLWEANVSASVQEDCSGVPVKRKKSKLSDEWKAYRCDTEWRCHWLELRIKYLQSRASNYDHILKGIQAQKSGANQKHFNNASAARAVPLIGYSRQRILHRKPKKVRSEIDLSTYMSQHPLFSLYENRTEPDALFFEDDPNCITDRDETDIQKPGFSYFSHHLGEPGTVDDQNKLELILCNIENLQSRIIRMKNRLNKFSLRKEGKIVTKNMAQNSLSIQSPKEAVEGPVCISLGKSRIQTGSFARRRISDFDINNVVMSENSMATYQPARHVFIKTPSWRLADDSIKMVHTGTEDNTSEEDTDDEIYIERHRDLELREKLLYEKSDPGKKLPASSRFDKGNSEPIAINEKSEKEIYASARGGELWSSGCFLPPAPKGRRSVRRSRSASIQGV